MPDYLKKAIALGVLTALLSFNFVFLLPRAEAQTGSLGAAGAACFLGTLGIRLPSVGSIIGSIISLGGGTPVPQPVVDADVRREIAQRNCRDFLDRLADLATKVALNILKKRLLDAVVDQTINWIQGNGSPQFVTNPGNFLEDIGQAAVGDFVQEIGFGRICSPFQARIQINIAQSFQRSGGFSQRASCTLDQVVGNFKDFYDDFSKGGWLAFGTALQPQNNYYGSLILAIEEANTREENALQKAQQEINQGEGYLPTKECLEWVFDGYDAFENPIRQVRSVNSSFDYPDPNRKPPPIPGLLGNWTCSPKSQITTTPGQVKKTATEKAVSLHTDYIINSDDLSEYAAAIIDAGINRLIKEGTKGILGLVTSPQNIPSQGYFTPGNIPLNVTSTGGAYSSSTNQQQTAAAQQQLLTSLATASSSLFAAQLGIQNSTVISGQLISVLQGFVGWCTSWGGAPPANSLHPISCNSLLTDVSNAQNQSASFGSDLALIATYFTDISNLTNTVLAGLTSLNITSVTQQITTLGLATTQLESTYASLPTQIQNQLNGILTLYNGSGSGLCEQNPIPPPPPPLGPPNPCP